MTRNDITVCTLSTRGYKKYAEQLRVDCDKFGYKFHNYFLDIDDPRDIDEILMQKPVYKVKAIEQFNRILWLDAESRIVKPFPEEWFDLKYEMVVAKYHRPEPKVLPTYNSGFLIIDRRQLDFMKTCAAASKAALAEKQWLRTSNPGADIPIVNDEVIQDAMFFSSPLVGNPNKLLIEYINMWRFQPGQDKITRGSWTRENTIITHENINFKNIKNSEMESILTNHFIIDSMTESQNESKIATLMTILRNPKSRHLSWKKLIPEAIYHEKEDMHEYNGWYFTDNTGCPINTAIPEEYNDYINRKR